MGIFSRKNKENREVKPNREETRQVAIYSVPISNDGDNISVYGLKTEARIDDRQTVLVSAKVQKTKEGEAACYSTGDNNIFFEISQGLEVNNQIIEAAVHAYLSRPQEYREQEECIYIGRLCQDMSNGRLLFGQGSQDVYNFVKSKIAPRIREERNERIANIENNRHEAQTEREFKQRLMVEQRRAERYAKNLAEERKERMQHPFLRYVGHFVKDRKMFADYNGVDLHTGDILRIRGLEKCGKDGSGTYLYKGYLSEAVSDASVEEFMSEVPTGVPVCFETKTRVEDIAQSQDPRQIQTLLELLSEYRIRQDNNKLKFLGGIDEQGRVYKTTRSDSPAIQVRVEQMQREQESIASSREQNVR